MAGLDAAGGPAPLRELLQRLPVAVAYVAGPDLVYEFANAHYRRAVGGRRLIGRPLHEALPEVSADRLAAIRHVLRTGRPLHGRESEAWIRLPGEEPEQRFMDFVFEPVPDAAGGVAGLLLCGTDVTGHVRDRRQLEELTDRLAATLTARQRAEYERATSLAREQEARVEASVARERLAFLLRAGDLVAAAGNPDDLLEQVTRQLVPALADYCVALQPTPDGKLCATMLTHHDPATNEVLMLLREHPIPAAGPLISQQAFTTGATQLAREFNARTPRWTDAAPGLMKVVEKVDPSSAVAVPLMAGERPFGVLVFGRGQSRPLFTETDVAVVEEIARRLSAGLANANISAREHTVAEILQRALLPAALPDVEELDLAVRYLPSSDEVNVGGDWYDAFPLSRGRVGLVVGDVAGHSIESAAVMGQIRSILHGYAIDDSAPEEVLRRTNAAVSQMLPDAVATACYAVLDPATGDVSYASAGHPPALVTTSQGHAGYLDSPPGTMLGVSAGTTFGVARRRLSPGSGLLFYTDGLIEHRQRDIADGLDALISTLQGALCDSAEQICRSVQTALLGSAPLADDVCILAVRLPDSPVSPGDLFAFPGAMTPENAKQSSACCWPRHAAPRHSLSPISAALATETRDKSPGVRGCVARRGIGRPQPAETRHRGRSRPGGAPPSRARRQAGFASRAESALPLVLSY